MSLTDYSDLEQEIRGVPPLRILPIGTEVKLRIIQVVAGESDYGKWYRLRLDIPAEPSVPEITDFISDPIDAKKSGDEKIIQKAYRKFNSFTLAFDIDISVPINWEDDLDGLEGWGLLGVKKSDEYGDQNTVSKYIMPK